MLPTLGKRIERLVKNRLLIHAYKNNFGTDQRGFMPHKSCEDAINKVIRITDQHSKNKKCVLWISVDFKSAFDTAWWPAILNGLIRKLKLPQNIFMFVSNYLKDRLAVIKQEGKVIGHRKLRKSCSQGSIISPFLWNVLRDDVLSTEIGCDKIAYSRLQKEIPPVIFTNMLKKKMLTFCRKMASRSVFFKLNICFFISKLTNS